MCLGELTSAMTITVDLGHKATKQTNIDKEEKLSKFKLNACFSLPRTLLVAVHVVFRLLVEVIGKAKRNLKGPLNKPVGYPVLVQPSSNSFKMSTYIAAHQ